MNRNRIAAALGLTLSLAACGGGGDGATSGTCDLTQDPARRECFEVTGVAPDIASARDDCGAIAGTWTSEACPVNADLIGCCSYELGLQVRECFYTNPDRLYDPQTRCTSTTFNGAPGVWEPAPAG